MSKAKNRGKRKRPSMVYAIQAGARDCIKIGRSVDPVNRLRNLQVASPDTLRLLGTTKGGSKTEKSIHEMLSGQRMSGEWFNISPEGLRELLPDWRWLEYPTLGHRHCQSGFSQPDRPARDPGDAVSVFGLRVSSMMASTKAFEVVGWAPDPISGRCAWFRVSGPARDAGVLRDIERRYNSALKWHGIVAAMDETRVAFKGLLLGWDSNPALENLVHGTTAVIGSATLDLCEDGLSLIASERGLARLLSPWDLKVSAS